MTIRKNLWLILLILLTAFALAACQPAAVTPVADGEATEEGTTDGTGTEEPTSNRPAELTFTVTWIGFWFHIPGSTLDPTEVTNTFFDNGADVVISGIDTTEGIVVTGQRAAEGDNVHAIPYDFEGACGQAPDVCLGVPYFNWGPAYVNEIQTVMDGEWQQHWDWLPPNWEDLNDPDSSNVGWITGPALGGEVPAVAEVADSADCTPDDFVFGMILVGPKDDHGWSQAHYEGGRYVEENITGTCMVVFENLNPGTPEATLEGVTDEMVAQGAQVIFTTSDEFEEDTVGAAQKYPEVIFVNISGDDAWSDGQDAGVAPQNEGNIMGRMEDMKAIAGCAAGLTTETGHIAYLGPLINFETRRLAASVYLGAKYCYENYPAGDDNAAANLDDFIAKLASGELNLWAGPINLQDGTEYIAEGEVATDQQVWYLPLLLEGMDGPSK